MRGQIARVVHDVAIGHDGLFRQVVLAAELGANFGNCGAHLAGVFFLAEIEEWFVYKRALMQTRAWSDGGFDGRHGLHLGRNFSGVLL